MIGKHIRNIFREGELEKSSVWAKFAYTASDGKDYQVDYYNLDVIILMNCWSEFVIFVHPKKYSGEKFLISTRQVSIMIQEGAKMITYRDVNGDSGVLAYDLGPDYIDVK